MEWKTIQGQLLAIVYNILSWIFDLIGIHKISGSLSKIHDDENTPMCIYVEGPGGLNKLKSLKIGNEEKEDEIFATVGYNIPAFPPPYIKKKSAYIASQHPELVLVKIKYFSINYADICIRWGLYESALRYVGWPIVPGFDFSGVVEEAGSDTTFQKGDEVFGFTMFGAYSSRVLVPHQQLQKIQATSRKHSLEAYAGFPAVAATALHAVRYLLLSYDIVYVYIICIRCICIYVVYVCVFLFSFTLMKFNCSYQ